MHRIVSLQKQLRRQPRHSNRQTSLAKYPVTLKIKTDNQNVEHLNRTSAKHNLKVSIIIQPAHKVAVWRLRTNSDSKAKGTSKFKKINRTCARGVLTFVRPTTTK